MSRRDNAHTEERANMWQGHASLSDLELQTLVESEIPNSGHKFVVPRRHPLPRSHLAATNLSPQAALPLENILTGGASRKRKRSPSLGRPRDGNLRITDTTASGSVATNNTLRCSEIIPTPSLSAQRASRSTVQVRLPGLVYPRSQYLPGPDLEATDIKAIIKEEDTLQYLTLVSALDGQEKQNRGYTVVKLTDFEIYRPPEVKIKHANTFTSLEALQVWRGVKVLLFDGELELNGTKNRVSGIPFETLSLDGYGTLQAPTCEDRVWIQSKEARARDIWYQLGTPSQQYRRFYQPFTWLVDFTRHFVNFLVANRRKSVGLEDFRNRFDRWLTKVFGADRGYQEWRQQSNRSDYRVYVCAHYEFLWKEAIDVNPLLRKHRIWQEVVPQQLNAISEQPGHEKRTVVTLYVYSVFQCMYFSSFLKQKSISPTIENKWLLRKTDLGFISELCRYSTSSATERSGLSSSLVPFLGEVEVGDIVAVDPDTKSKWKVGSTQYWFGYVQRLEHDEAGGTAIKVLWLYRPRDTSCGKMRYPFEHELFMSDNCNCGDERLLLHDIRMKLRVRLLFVGAERRHVTENEVFIRQCYLSDDSSFVTLQQKHLSCNCHSRYSYYERVKDEFSVKDTVLVKLGRGKLLEPAFIKDFNEEDGVEVRLFRRRHELGDSNALPHELVYDRQAKSKVWVPHKSVIRKCHVRRFYIAAVRNGEVPTPYSYGGVGDCWLLTGLVRLNKDGIESVENLEDTPRSFHQGFDPTLDQHPEPLNGLGLFAGGGSFDRGLSEGTAVNFKWAVEWDASAMHTYRANVDPFHDTQLFRGSVNDFLALALKGNTLDSVPQIGTVHFISAGSPCQGFSSIQSQKLSKESCQNASMIASVIAHIDFYCPKYAIMENVHAMCSDNLGPNKDENVFAQVICALVGLGYQVQQFNVDAWSYGSPQNRSRLFIVAAAPGLIPLGWIPHTHARPDNIQNRTIGKLNNGLSFGHRDDEYTPFPLPSAQDATKDLPSIGDGAVESCTFHPDHRIVGQVESYQHKAIYRHIPKVPRGKGWAYAVQNELMPKAIVSYVHGTRARNATWSNLATNKAYVRVVPEKTFSTVLTKPVASDAITGRLVHWEEDRPLTILEARRAQTIPDHEVIVGLPSTQWKIIGNGVPRTVAVAFGMAFREACLKNESHLIVGSNSPTVKNSPDYQSQHQSLQEACSVDSTRENGVALIKKPSLGSDTVQLVIHSSSAPKTPYQKGDSSILYAHDQDISPKEILSQHRMQATTTSEHQSHAFHPIHNSKRM